MKKLVALTMMIGFLSAPVTRAGILIPIEGAGAVVGVVGIYLLAKHHNKKQDEKQAEFLSQPAPSKKAPSSGAKNDGTKK